MLQGFDSWSYAGLPKKGRPLRPPSYGLRNLAWLRHLLSALDDVNAWAGGPSNPSKGRGQEVAAPEEATARPVPQCWTTHRSADAKKLSRVLTGSRRPAIGSNPLSRQPPLLDEVFGCLFHNDKDSTGRYFGDRIARNLTSPDASVLKRLDDLVPGSRGAFEFELGGLDRWFYDALDFTNPWYGKLYMWRACDPNLQDPQWERWLSEPDEQLVGMPTLSELTRNERTASFVMSDDDRIRLGEMILGAVAFTAEPGLVDAPDTEAKHVAAEMLAAAAAPQAGRMHPIARSVAQMPSMDRWAALSNAVTGCRLAAMVEGEQHLASWWLAGVRQALQVDIDQAQREHYCPVPAKPKKLPALDALLDRVS